MLEQLTSQEQQALQQFQQAVSARYGSEGIAMWLFGSRARHEGDEESDLDVLVLLDTYTDAIKIGIWDMAYAVFAQTDVVVSPQVLSRKRFEQLQARERLIAQNITQDGIPLLPKEVPLRDKQDRKL